MSSRTAFAPATVANLIVGFDLLGLALETAVLGDTVKVTKTRGKEICIKTVQVANAAKNYIDAQEIKNIPLDPAQNTATAGLLKLVHDKKINFGFEIEITKGIPLGSGLGGSAASAVACLIAANELLPKQLTKAQLLTYALDGEAAASGSRHGDNVGPCLFGGMVLVQPEQNEILQIPYPKDLCVVVVYPGFRLDTRQARQVLPPTISLQKHIQANARLAGFISGCFLADIKIIQKSLEDSIIEPARAHLISGFKEVQSAALAAGALGCSISGAGPSVFAFCKNKDSKKIQKLMLNAFKKSGHQQTQSWVSKINKKGARIIK